MSETEARPASAAEIEAISAISDPMAECLMSLPGQTGLHALCLLSATMVMYATTSISKVEAWDHIAASIRLTIEANVKRGLS